MEARHRVRQWKLVQFEVGTSANSVGLIELSQPHVFSFEISLQKWKSKVKQLDSSFQLFCNKIIIGKKKSLLDLDTVLVS